MRIDALKPYVFQFVGGVGPQIIGIFISSLIVRSAGIDEFGRYTLLQGIIVIFYSVIGSALDTNYQRSCQVSNYSEVFSAKIFVWLLVVSFIIVGAYASDSDATALIFLFIGVFFQQLVETRVTRDRIEGRDVNAMLPRLLPVGVFAIIIYLSQPGNVFEVSILFVAAWITSLYFIHPLIGSVTFSIKKSIGHLKAITPIWISLLLTQVYGNIDSYIISFFYSNAEVGIYKIAYTFASISMPLTGVFSFIFLSKISAAIRDKNYISVKKTYRKQKYFIFILCVCVLIFNIFLFPFIGEHLYGHEVKKAILTNKILAVAMTFNMLSMVYVYMMLALGEERLIAFMTMLGCIMYLILACLLVPIYSSNGAAVSMCLTNLFLLLVYRFFYVRDFDVMESKINWIR